MKLIVKTRADLTAEAAAAERTRATADARCYLAETDWMVIREAETGQPVSESVRAARADARRILSAQSPG